MEYKIDNVQWMQQTATSKYSMQILGYKYFHEYDSGWNPWENVLYLFKACLPKWLISRGKEVFENTW